MPHLDSQLVAAALLSFSIASCSLLTGGEAPDETTTDTGTNDADSGQDDADASTPDVADTAVVDTDDDTTDTDVEDASDTRDDDTADTDVEDADTEIEDTADTEIEDTADTEIEDTADTELVDASDATEDPDVTPGPLTLTAISPDRGPREYAQVVELVGTGFVEGMTVTFGTEAATVVSTTDTSATVRIPASSAFGVVDVSVERPTEDPVSLVDAYRFFAEYADFDEATAHSFPVAHIEGDRGVMGLAIGDVLPSPGEELVVLHWHSLEIFTYDGGGAYTAARDLIEEDGGGFQSDVRDLLLADVDGDGDLDVVHTATASLVVWENEAGIFSPTTEALSFTPSRVEVLDLNDDTDDDLVVVGPIDAPITSWVTVLRNDGDARRELTRFDVEAAGYRVQTGGQVAIGDLNGDGLDDVVVPAMADSTALGAAGVLVFEGTDRGLTGVGPDEGVPYGIVGPAEGAGAMPVDVALGDIDGDGDTDIVAGVIFSQSFWTWRQESDGSFTPSVVPSGVAGPPRAVQLGDFNGDGYLDVVTCGVEPNQTLLRVNVVAGTPTGTMAPGASYTHVVADSGASQTYCTQLLAHDVDHDGLMDFVIGYKDPREATPRLAVYLNASDG